MSFPPFRLSALSSYYVKSLPRGLHGAGRLGRFVFSSALHAASHALVALVGSALALTLAAQWSPGGQAPGRFVSACRSSSSSLSPLFCSLLGAGPGATAKLAERQAFSLSVVGLVVLVVKGASGVYATYIQTRIAGQVGCGLRLELLDALLAIHRLRHPRHGDHGRDAVPTARAVAGLTDRIRDVEVGLSHGFFGGGRAAAQLVPLAGVLAALSPRAAAVAAAVLASFGWLLGRWRRGYREDTRRAARRHEDLLEAADDSVRHADLWVSYGAEGSARSSVRRLGDAVADGWSRLEARAAALSGTNEALGAAALAVAIAGSRWGWLGTAGGGATLLAFAVTFFLAYRPLRELADARAVFVRAQVAYDELDRVIQRARALRPGGSGSGGAEPSSRRAWPLAPLELGALRLVHGACGPIDLCVAAGSIAVVTGPTGAGKTTLLRTLLGLEEPLGGEVTYGGVSLSDAPAGPAARPFAWVPQDAPLVADTLSANVGLGTSGVDVRALLDPIGASRLAGEIEAASRLGEGGRPVSGGERQWIALARALATGQPVLLLDEPTSGLDPAAQRKVLQVVDGLRGVRTVILVTHRPEPLAIADVVLRIDPSASREVASRRDAGPSARAGGSDGHVA